MCILFPPAFLRVSCLALFFLPIKWLKFFYCLRQIVIRWTVSMISFFRLVQIPRLPPSEATLVLSCALVFNFKHKTIRPVYLKAFFHFGSLPFFDRTSCTHTWVRSPMAIQFSIAQSEFSDWNVVCEWSWMKSEHIDWLTELHLFTEFFNYAIVSSVYDENIQLSK